MSLDLFDNPVGYLTSLAFFSGICSETEVSEQLYYRQIRIKDPIMENRSEKEYLLSLLTQFKLNGRELERLEKEIRIREGRIELAGKAEKEDLVLEAETEAGKLKAKTEELKTETANLKAEIEKLRGNRELSAEIELAVLKSIVEGGAGDRPSPSEVES
jgi:hypothetical protein